MMKNLDLSKFHLYGNPGCGKSSFIHSISTSNHLSYNGYQVIPISFDELENLYSSRCDDYTFENYEYLCELDQNVYNNTCKNNEIKNHELTNNHNNTIHNNNNNSYDELKCSICLIKIEIKNEKIKEGCIISCSHFYHKKCINAWLNKNKNCPLCRKECLKYDNEKKEFIKQSKKNQK